MNAPNIEDRFYFKRGTVSRLVSMIVGVILFYFLILISDRMGSNTWNQLEVMLTDLKGNLKEYMATSMLAAK